MGSIACSRCGATIKLNKKGPASVTPIAVTDRKEGTKYLKFVCDECKEYVIRKTYQQLHEETLREPISNIDSK